MPEKKESNEPLSNDAESAPVILEKFVGFDLLERLLLTIIRGHPIADQSEAARLNNALIALRGSPRTARSDEIDYTAALLEMARVRFDGGPILEGQSARRVAKHDAELARVGVAHAPAEANSDHAKATALRRIFASREHELRHAVSDAGEAIQFEQMYALERILVIFGELGMKLDLLDGMPEYQPVRTNM